MSESASFWTAGGLLRERGSAVRASRRRAPRRRRNVRGCAARPPVNVASCLRDVVSECVRVEFA